MRPIRRGTIGAVTLAIAVAGPTCAYSQEHQDAADKTVLTETSVQPRNVTIGSPFRYSTRYDAESGIELALPLPTENIGRFFILDFGEVAATIDATRGRVVYERWYDLIAYQTGDDLVPGLEFKWRGTDGEIQTAYLPDTPVSIESVLPTAPDSSDPIPLAQLDLLDIKAPIRPPRKPLPVWWIAAGVLIGLSLGTFLYRAWSRGRVTVAHKPLAHEIALGDLRALRDGALFRESYLGEFYVELSNVMRAYLEARFALRAPEMTTEEFLQAAHQGSEMTGEERGSLQIFLCEADLVKFARMHPNSNDADRAWTAADSFVRATAIQPEVADAMA